MKWFIKLLGAIVLLYGTLEGSLTLISIDDYSHIKLMFETSKSLADLFSYGSEYILILSKLVKGISLIVSGLIFGALLLAASIIIENQEMIIELVKKKKEII